MLMLLFSLIIAVCLSTDIRSTRLLPTDGSVVHCAGQTNQNWSDVSMQTFNNYSDYLSKGTKPQTFMIYFGVTLDVPTINSWFDTFTQKMNAYPSDTWYTVQMGLWFYDVNGNTFDCDIMNGKLDANITAMINGFNKLGRPVYLRIGYEFNGPWTGFTPACYIGAFQYLTKKLRADAFCKDNVATVWDFTADAGTTGYMDWYPGDDYVDWWGVNIFGCWGAKQGTCVPSNAGVNSPIVVNYLNAAAAKGFPVMFGESTPRQLGNGVGTPSQPQGCTYEDKTLNATAWDVWYEPYFAMINNSSYTVQGFCYINWWWWQWGYNWGQSEINECPVVGPKYQNEISNGNYCNAMDEAATKKILGL